MLDIRRSTFDIQISNSCPSLDAFKSNLMVKSIEVSSTEYMDRAYGSQFLAGSFFYGLKSVVTILFEATPLRRFRQPHSTIRHSGFFIRLWTFQLAS